MTSEVPVRLRLNSFRLAVFFKKHPRRAFHADALAPRFDLKPHQVRGSLRTLLAYDVVVRRRMSDGRYWYRLSPRAPDVTTQADAVLGRLLESRVVDRRLPNHWRRTSEGSVPTPRTLVARVQALRSIKGLPPSVYEPAEMEDAPPEPLARAG